MSPQDKSAIALRPMLPDDVPTLADIFRESILELTGDDYTEAQQEAWIASVDEDDFKARLARALTLVATVGGAPVGFASLENNTKIEFFYVHPVAGGQGVGAMLADALEKLAGARGAARLEVDASDTAYGFFSHRGYVAQSRNSVPRGDEWLANTTMHKALGAKPDGAKA